MELTPIYLKIRTDLKEKLDKVKSLTRLTNVQVVEKALEDYFKKNKV